MGETVAVGVEQGEVECFAQVPRQVAKQMTSAAVVMMVGVFVAMMTVRLAVVVASGDTSVDCYGVIPVCGVACRRLPGEGRR
ncbi:MAG: hypothetical protein IH606_12045 [Burkholderiales bacterium]|nr:hypothetical protein [Burkholderiales bacterium]